MNNPSLIIQRITFIEISRNPVYYLVLGFASFVIFLSQKLALFSFHTELNMIRELGLSTIVLWGVLTCILFTHQSVFSEIENRSALTLLSKPVRRPSYVLGKYLGLARALLLGAAFLTLVLILTLWIHEGIPKLDRAVLKSSSTCLHYHMDRPPLDALSGTVHSLGGSAYGILVRDATTSHYEVWSYFTTRFLSSNVWPMVVGGLLSFFQVGIIASFSLGLATFFPTVVVASGTLAFYVVGHLSDFLIGALRIEGALAYIVRQLVRCVLPNLEQFNPVDHLSRGESLPAIYVALAITYGILYVSVILGITAFAFSRRELA